MYQPEQNALKTAWAVILARAGVERLELMKSPYYVTKELSPEKCYPHPLGALGIQMRRGDPDAAAERHCTVTNAACVALERP